MTNKVAEGKLKSGAPRRKGGRPPGSLNKRTILREAIRKGHPGGEPGFWLAVVKLAASGDVQSMAMIADRLMPRLKPASDPIILPEPLDGSPADMARQIMRATSQGQIAPDTARELLSALADVAKIIEASELEERLSALEKTSGATPPKGGEA